MYALIVISINSYQSYIQLVETSLKFVFSIVYITVFNLIRVVRDRDSRRSGMLSTSLNHFIQ